MLEQIARVRLVEKLRHTQLYKVDFNFFQQFVFGQEDMNELVENGYLPKEHFSQKGSTAEDTKLYKTLMTDLSCQARYPLAIISVDAAQCYARVNHVIMSLIWSALIGHIEPISSLTILANNEIFQQTGFGDSQSHFGGSHLIKYLMGLVQGSRETQLS